MKHRKKDTLEKLIKEAVHNELENSPPPSLSVNEAWEKLNNTRNNNPISTKKSPYIFKKAVLASLIIVTSVMLFLPNSNLVFGQLSNVIQKAQGTVIHLFMKPSESQYEQTNTPSPEDFTIIEDSTIVSKQVSLEEARKNTSFTIRIPKFVPEQFTLKNVTLVTKSNELSNEVFLNYTSSKREFTINEKIIGESFGSGISADKDDTTMEQVLINGNEASLLKYKNGFIRLVWLDKDYYYSISGELSKEEIISIAETL